MEVQTIAPAQPCNSMEARYRKTISNYMQTDPQGHQLKLRFRIIHFEIHPCTIADCIQRMYEDAREERFQAVQEEMKKMMHWNTLLDTQNQNPGYASEMIKRSCRQKIRLSVQRIDLLEQKLPTENILCYDNLDKEQVVSLLATCQYRIFNPKEKVYQEKSEVFVLSPNGKEVLGKEYRSIK